jgi:hypothetical protein
MGFVDAPDPRAVVVNEIERLEVTEEETNHRCQDISTRESPTLSF